MQFFLFILRLFPASPTLKKLAKVRRIIETSEIGGRIFVYCKQYDSFVTMEVILHEISRNILIVIIAVLVCTMMILANFRTAVIISLTVLSTLINVGGYMYFLGMHLETASTVMLTVAQGITVDYSAHIGHAFLVARGHTREDRVKYSLQTIGPAVFNGAFSTLVSLILLAFASSPILFMFFKVFSLTIYCYDCANERKINRSRI